MSINIGDWVAAPGLYKYGLVIATGDHPAIFWEGHDRPYGCQIGSFFSVRVVPLAVQQGIRRKYRAYLSLQVQAP